MMVDSEASFFYYMFLMSLRKKQSWGKCNSSITVFNGVKKID